MSWLTWIADFRGVTAQLHRIADALDRAYPIPKAEEDAAAEQDVTYSNDEASARQELLDEAKRMGYKFDDAGNLIEPDDAEEDEPSTPRR